MTSPPFRIEQFHKNKHDRSGFDCGVQTLNDYFRVQVGQDVRRNVTTCYVAVENENETSVVAGFYTLAMGSVLIGELPEKVAKRLPRYPSVPVVRIGRLAIDRRYQGRKIGAGFLGDAIQRAIGSGVASFAVVVDAKDDSAVAFYEHHGFIRFKSHPTSLFLPISDDLCNSMERLPR